MAVNFIVTLKYSDSNKYTWIGRCRITGLGRVLFRDGIDGGGGWKVIIHLRDIFGNHRGHNEFPAFPDREGARKEEEVLG